MGTKLWNEIPSSLRELPKKSFKLRIKNKLLSVLEDEDSFIDICRIITQAVRPGFSFRLSFFFPRSVTNRCLASRAQTHTETQLLLHAQHEKYHLVTQQITTLSDYHQLQTQTNDKEYICRKNTNAHWMENALNKI